MLELAIQKCLVDAANDQVSGGHAFKMKNQFVKGISDLSVTLPAYPTVFIEVKLGIANVLSPHQSEFLRKHCEAGGMGGWVKVWPNVARRGSYFLFAEIGNNRTTSPPTGDEAGFFRKEVGRPWPVVGVVDHIVKGCKRV